MQKLLPILFAMGMMIAGAYALDDSEGYKIIQNGDSVLLEPGAKLFVNLADLKAANKASMKLKGLEEGKKFNKVFFDLVANKKAFETDDFETARILQHDDEIRIAKVKISGLILWVDQSFIKPDRKKQTAKSY